MLDLVLIWGLLLVALIMLVIGRARSAGALALAYFLGLSLIHVPGVLIYFGNGAQFFDEEQIKLGFEITLFGMAAFVVGAVLARNRANGESVKNASSHTKSVGEFYNDGWPVVIIGAIAYLFLGSLSSIIPSMDAIVSAMSTLFVVGLWIELYTAKISDDRRRLTRALAMLPILPVVSLVSAGFMGHGVSWALSVSSFLFVIARRRLYFFLTVPAVLFLGLSIFVTYMGQRQDIRKVVWNQDTNIIQRVSTISKVVTEFEFLNLDSYNHRYALFSRLNQNMLVGVGAKRHVDGLNELFYGDTLPWWALIPRAIWPTKPQVGGGGDLVASFTKIKFDRTTSIGVGQVLEFYMNFGSPGVLLGFMTLGFLLMRLDEGIMSALLAGDTRGVIIRAMPGLTILQPGGNMLEIVVGVISAIVAAQFLFYFKILRARPVSLQIVADAQLHQGQGTASSV